VLPATYLTLTLCGGYQLQRAWLQDVWFGQVIKAHIVKEVVKGEDLFNRSDAARWQTEHMAARAHPIPYPPWAERLFHRHAPFIIASHCKNRAQTAP